TGSPHSAALSGAGNTAPQVSLNPGSLTFPGQNVGSTSTAQTVTLNNTGSAALSISSIAITGANAADFAQSNNCAATLAAGANCTLSVTFTPTASGARSAAVTVTDNASGSPHSAALSGAGNTAPQVSLNPASLTFPGQNVGSTSTAQTVTLNNTGSAALSISSIAITGANAADFAQSNN